MAEKLTKQEWLELVNEFEQSKETQPDFSKMRGLNIATFRYWLYKVRRHTNKQAIEATDVEFVEVRSSPISSSSAFRICIEQTTIGSPPPRLNLERHLHNSFGPPNIVVATLREPRATPCDPESEGALPG